MAHAEQEMKSPALPARVADFDLKHRSSEFLAIHRTIACAGRLVFLT
jgi:hypothetical protein